MILKVPFGRELKIVSGVFLISLPLWWAVDVAVKQFTDFLLLDELTQNTQILAAETREAVLKHRLRLAGPTKNRAIENLELGAESAISVLLTRPTAPGLTVPQWNEKILFQKESDKVLRIASLTKLMTAYAAIQNYDLNEILEISPEIIYGHETFGQIKVGEQFKIKDLLYLLLMESSNEAAKALSQKAGDGKMVEWMNLNAQDFGLTDTFFVNTTGLDPDCACASFNRSSAKDLVQLTKHLLQESLIWEILSTAEFDLYLPDGVLHHRLQNTNEILNSQEPWVARIIGGKTGQTPLAQGCLLLVVEAPKSKGFLVNIILGSQDRFEEMEKMVNWIHQAYNW